MVRYENEIMRRGVKVHRKAFEELIPMGSGSNRYQRSWTVTATGFRQDAGSAFRDLKGTGGQDA